MSVSILDNFVSRQGRRKPSNAGKRSTGRAKPAPKVVSAVASPIPRTGDQTKRFRVAMTASLMLHAIVLFGITVRPPDRANLDPITPTLDVVLVNASSTNKPANAQLLAQHSLDGGGNVDADRRATSPLPVQNEKQTVDLTLEARRVEQLEQEAKRLMTQMASQTKVDTTAAEQLPKADARTGPDAVEVRQRSLEIMRLDAQIAKDLEAYNKRPRRQFIGARTQDYRYARYIDDWRMKIERIGTLNYPQAARDMKIFGSLQLTVSIRQDGSVEDIEINRSSGQKILDDAAVRIVKLASPFMRLPPDIAKDWDILHITRTWTFTRSDQLSTE